MDDSAVVALEAHHAAGQGPATGAQGRTDPDPAADGRCHDPAAGAVIAFARLAAAPRPIARGAFRLSAAPNHSLYERAGHNQRWLCDLDRSSRESTPARTARSAAVRAAGAARAAGTDGSARCGSPVAGGRSPHLVFFADVDRAAQRKHLGGYGILAGRRPSRLHSAEWRA